MGAGASHPLPQSAGFCRVIDGFLSPEECRRHIARSEARGFAGAGSDYPPSYRNNERQVVDDPGLAAQLFARLAPHAPPRWRHAESDWALDGINERFRYCRYQAGQQFNLHQDGVHHRGPGWQSCITFMIYLTDGEAFEGGDTLFWSAGPAGDAAGRPSQLIGRVRPRAGSLILFDHALWHAGDTVTRGVKHILRSDVLYRRQAPEAQANHPFEPGHAGYVWTMALLPGATPGEPLVASGGRDALVRLWQPQGRPAGVLQGHEQSVLGLAPLPHGRLASVSRDRTLRVWDVAARRCLNHTRAHEASVLALAACPDGTLATGGADALVRLWQGDGTPLATLAGHAGWVWSVQPWGPHGLASASEDGTVKLWDRRSGRCLHTLRGPSALRDVLVLPGGEQLLTGDLNGVITTWSRSGEDWHMTHHQQAHAAAVRRLRLVGPGRLASAGEDHRACLWHLADRTLLAHTVHDNFATDVLALDDRYLSCAYDGQIRATPLL